MAQRTGHGKRLSYYDFGHTTVFAYQADPRFAYTLYVPKDYDEDGATTYRLIVAIHGTARNFIDYRNRFAALAERHGCIVLAPLFPAGITTPNDLSSYKLLRVGQPRYDLLLLGMIDEIGRKYRLDDERFLLHGFSGGGHFTHRFLYAHPERLRAVSIGAPGIVTLLDFEHDYWVGVRNFHEVHGKPIDLAAMRNVAVQTVIGGDDTETWEITVEPGDPLWMPGAEISGPNRQNRMRALNASFEQHGIEVRHDVIPGVAHEAAPLTDAVMDFFSIVLG